jgi:hypothetical protein
LEPNVLLQHLVLLARLPGEAGVRISVTTDAS